MAVVSTLIDLTRYRGDTYPVTYYLVTKVTQTNPTQAPVDLTGWAFTLTVNTEFDPVDITNQLEQVIGVVTDATGGVVEFPMLTVDLPVGDMFYDVQSVDSDGYKKTQGKARLTILQDITKT